MPILGIIDQPITGERWVGVVGRPTTLNGEPVRTRACPDLGGAALFTTGPERYQGGEAAAFERLREAVGMTQYSADCYATALLATGCVDLVIESGLKVYDYLALAPVVLGAGGLISEWGGGPLGLESDGTLLAAGDPKAYAAARALLAGA